MTPFHALFRPASPRFYRRGFTLIELCVVITIIAIVSALLIPEMAGSFQDALLRASGRTLQDAFAVASSRAVTWNEDCRVRLDRAAGGYVLERCKVERGREEFVPLRDVDLGQGKIDPRVTVEVRAMDELALDENPAPGRPAPLKNDCVGFYADGTADPAEVRLKDASGFVLRLQLDPVTARVRVLEPERQ